MYEAGVAAGPALAPASDEHQPSDGTGERLPHFPAGAGA